MDAQIGPHGRAHANAAEPIDLAAVLADDAELERIGAGLPGIGTVGALLAAWRAEAYGLGVLLTPATDAPTEPAAG